MCNILFIGMKVQLARRNSTDSLKWPTSSCSLFCARDIHLGPRQNPRFVSVGNITEGNLMKRVDRRIQNATSVIGTDFNIPMRLLSLHLTTNKQHPIWLNVVV